MTYFIGNHNIKYAGPVNLIAFVKMIHDWFVEQEWISSPEGSAFPEIYYSHAKSQPSGQEIWIWWRFHWAPQGNRFYRYLIRLSFHSFRMKEQEMVINNRKEKMYNGDHQVIITAILETDWTNQWKNHPLLKHFYHVFHTRIQYQDFEKRKAELHHISQHLQTDIKTFFDTHHFMHHGRPFHPKLGVREEHPVGP
ncbi:MAG: hypothetical protein GXP63_04110 [DPANN group archaeon]|nr:hypothetical protein [DPANN group archaeon]